MIRYPGVQRRASEEIDLLLGQDRWPDVVTDREGLQYLECVLQEVMRCVVSTEVPTDLVMMLSQMAFSCSSG